MQSLKQELLEGPLEPAGGLHLEALLKVLEDPGVELLDGGDAPRGNLLRPEDDVLLHVVVRLGIVQSKPVCRRIFVFQLDSHFQPAELNLDLQLV